MKTKNYMKKLITILLLGATSWGLQAQCNHNPTITNPNLLQLEQPTIMLCGPQETAVLSTQVYDSYQWYRKDYVFAPDVPQWVAIPGATSQTLTIVGETDLLSQFKVAATLNGCTEESPEIIIDAYAFSSPSIQVYITANSYQIVYDDMGGIDHVDVCNGSSVLLKDTHPAQNGVHTWFKCLPSTTPPASTDPCVIPGATGDEITITTTGVYGFYACTEICPNTCMYAGSNGLTDIRFGNFTFCTLGNQEQTKENTLTLYPNPTDNYLFIGKEEEIYKELIIIDMTGKTVLMKENHQYNVPINVTQLSAGTYNIISKTNEGKIYKNKFIKE